MDYCLTCRRHLNGALTCPGCGAARSEQPLDDQVPEPALAPESVSGYAARPHPDQAPDAVDADDAAPAERAVAYAEPENLPALGYVEPEHPRGGPEYGDPEYDEQDYGESEFREPAYVEQGYVEPEYPRGGPGLAQQEYAGPDYAEPQYAEPGYLQPGYGELEAGGAERRPEWDEVEPGAGGPERDTGAMPVVGGRAARRRSKGKRRAGKGWSRRLILSAVVGLALAGIAVGLGGVVLPNDMTPQRGQRASSHPSADASDQDTGRSGGPEGSHHPSRSGSADDDRADPDATSSTSADPTATPTVSPEGGPTAGQPADPGPSSTSRPEPTGGGDDPGPTAVPDPDDCFLWWCV